MDEYRKILSALAHIYTEKTFFFVVGWNKPGTYWLQRALDEHAAAACRGEGHFTDRLFPLLERAVGTYNQEIKKTNDRLQASGFERGFEGYSRADLEILQQTAAGLVLGRWAGGAAVRAVGEKTTEHTGQLEKLGQMFPQPKIIHVIRDGRDEAVTAWDLNRRIGGEAFQQKFPSLAAFAEAFGRNWNAATGNARNWGRANKEQYLEVRAEDLLNVPETDMRRVLEFLGLAAGDGDIAACAHAGKKAVESAAVGGPGQWRQRFDADSSQAFGRQAGELLKLLEYEN